MLLVVIPVLFMIVGFAWNTRFQHPVNFRITSASVMNSFFIPQLGSQIYSMAGMETNCCT